MDVNQQTPYNLTVPAVSGGANPFPGFCRHWGEFVFRRQESVATRIQPGVCLFGQGEHFRRE